MTRPPMYAEQRALAVTLRGVRAGIRCAPDCWGCRETSAFLRTLERQVTSAILTRAAGIARAHGIEPRLRGAA